MRWACVWTLLITANLGMFGTGQACSTCPSGCSPQPCMETLSSHQTARELQPDPHAGRVAGRRPQACGLCTCCLAAPRARGSRRPRSGCVRPWKAESSEVTARVQGQELERGQCHRRAHPTRQAGSWGGRRLRRSRTVELCVPEQARARVAGPTPGQVSLGRREGLTLPALLIFQCLRLVQTALPVFCFPWRSQALGSALPSS